MKVLHINNNYIYTHLHQQLAEELQKNGVENLVFSPVVKGAKAVVEVNENVMVRECFGKWDKISFYYKQEKILSALKECIKGETFDLIHAYTLFTDGNAANRLSKETGIPYVVAIRNTDVNAFFRLRPYLRTRAIRILRGASRIFFLSESYKKRVLEDYIPKKYHRELLSKIDVIPNGIGSLWHEENVIKKEKTEDPIRVVCAGRVDHNKNYLTTAKACQILKNKGENIEFHAVGRVGDEKVLEKLKAYDFVTYHKPTDARGLMELYKDKTLFVMPSFQESFGLVYAEAMSQGLPVIYTRGEGFGGQFPEGEVGFAVDPGNPEEISEKIEEILSNYEILSENCIQNSKKFNWESISSKYASIYQKILKIER